MHSGLWITIFLIIHRRWGGMREHTRAPLPTMDRRGISRISYIVRDTNNFPVAFFEDALLDAPRA